MPRPGAVFGGAAKPLLEIKPDSPFVVFYGESSEAQNAELTGKLILTNPESISVKSIRMTLKGVRKISWNTTNTVTPQPITNKCHFLTDTQHIFPVDASKNKAHKVNAGSHEWPFKFTMPSNSDESVEGLSTNWIVYTLTATVERGPFSAKLHASTHIRVIRTLGRDLMETMPMDQINEDIWASKLAYKITVPQKNYIVGTSVSADFVLIPLRKGVEITTIKMELIESRQLFCDYAGRRISHNHELVVATSEGNMPDNSAHTVPDGVEEGDELFDESHRFSMSLELPKSLKYCRQSVDTENIRLSHKLRLYVNLHNPEGHTSQLLVKNHLHLFISPNLPPNEDQSVVVDQSILSAQAMQDVVNQNAPPLYGLHILDNLYNDIDPSGFMTPGFQSGANTPFHGLSRSGSEEDLTSMDAVAQQTGGGASAAALHNRLHDLNISQNNRSTRFAPSRQHSSGGSTPHSMPDDAPLHAPPSGYFANADLHQNHPDYDMEALARTPSYNTAVRTPARTPMSQDLPTYEIATSRPSSPTRTPIRSGATTPNPACSLDTLAEETTRNTQMNSRRVSPQRSSTRTSDEGSQTPTSSSPPSSSSSTSSMLSVSRTQSRSSSQSSAKTAFRLELAHQSSSASLRDSLHPISTFRRVLRSVG